jgi:hypothetical protein
MTSRATTGFGETRATAFGSDKEVVSEMLITPIPAAATPGLNFAPFFS